MRGGTWNCLGAREDNAVALQAWMILKDERLSFLALNEAGEYVDDLERTAPNGARVIRSGTGTPPRGSCALLVAPGVKVSGVLNPKMTTHGWYTVRGHLTGPKYAASAVLSGWLRVTVVHYPPSVWARGWANAPWRRARAYREHMIALLDFLRAHRHRTVAIGDWNATPSNIGLWSPRWLRRKLAGSIIAPSSPTHGRRVIDFAVARGIVGRASTRAKFGSDHSAVVFELDPKR